MVHRYIETTSLFVLIALAVLRPLVAESYDSAGGAFTAALGEIGDPSPAATLVFDVLILLSACGWLLARAIGPFRPYRRTGLEWGLALVAIAAVVSCLFAGNQRLALNASIDWLCYPVAAIVLVQLMRQPWRRRILLAAVLASACVQAAHCLEQHFVGFGETREHYQSIRVEFWADQGVELDSSQVELFERRMLAREAAGFMPHSNVAGSYLVLCGFAAIALTVVTWRRARDPGGRALAAACALGVVIIVAAAVTTKSRGALLSGVAGLVLLVLAWRMRFWIDSHRVKALVIGWACVIAGGAAVVGHGLHHGTLPGASLAFRWDYWRASAELIGDHPMTGVGRENFGRHYLRYKSIESPEEVANPHNLFVQSAADFGLVGLAGVAAMLIGGSIALCGPIARRRARNDAAPRGGDVSSGTSVRALPAERSARAVGFGVPWAVVLLLVVTIGRIPLLGSTDADFVYYATVTTGLIWLVGFALFMAGDNLIAGGSSGRAESGGSVVGTGVAIGLFAFLLHDMINFAMFVPGTAMTFFALLAYCIAERRSEDSGQRQGRPRSVGLWVAFAAAVVVTSAIVAVPLIPVARANRHLSAAKAAANSPVGPRIADHPAEQHFLAAAAADPLDPTPHVSRAGWLMAVAGIPQLRDEAWNLAEGALGAAIERDPYRASLHRTLMNLHLDRAEANGQSEDWTKAIEEARAALALYPQDPAGIAALADCQLRAGLALQSDDLLGESIAGHERALALDQERPEWETLRRFRQREIDEIRASIVEAEAAVTRTE